MAEPIDELRVLMCPQCGAPAEVPDAGGRVACAFCDGVLEVRPRMVENVVIEQLELDPSLGLEEREVARMASLRRQADNYNENNPYSFYEAPPGYEYLSGVNELDDSVATMTQQAFQAAVVACPARRGSIPQQRAVYWLARKLKNVWSQRKETLRARAALHTAHETVSDPGFLHLLRTSLADLARYEGDTAGARTWLSRCDDAPGLLDLDTSYRTSRAVLAVMDQDWAEVLKLVGEGRGEIPFEPSSIAVMHGLRVEAFEQSGRPEEARAELQWLIEDSPVPVDFLRTMFEGSATWEGCRAVWARIDASKVSTRSASPAISVSDLDALRSPTPPSSPGPVEPQAPQADVASGTPVLAIMVVGVLVVLATVAVLLYS